MEVMLNNSRCLCETTAAAAVGDDEAECQGSMQLAQRQQLDGRQAHVLTDCKPHQLSPQPASAASLRQPHPRQIFILLNMAARRQGQEGTCSNPWQM